MSKKFKSVQEFFDAAKKAGGDSLGIWNDPEALMEIANLSRQRFVEKNEASAFEAWVDAVWRIHEMNADEGNVRGWVKGELLRIGEVSNEPRNAKNPGLVEARTNVQLLGAIREARSSVSAAEQERLSSFMTLSLLARREKKEEAGDRADSH